MSGVRMVCPRLINVGLRNGLSRGYELKGCLGVRGVDNTSEG